VPGETEVLEEKPAPVQLRRPQIPHGLIWNPGRRGGQPTTNHVGYGTAQNSELLAACLINQKKNKTN
jgi:hypothetical protein